MTLERWWDDIDRGEPKNWVEEPASVSHDDDDDDDDDDGGDGEEEGDAVNGDANSWPVCENILNHVVQALESCSETEQCGC